MVTSKQLNVTQKAGKEFSHAVGKHSHGKTHDSTLAGLRQIRSCLVSPFSHSALLSCFTG